ncbi:MAG TPA: recombination protein O N-terminal domain-containing protein [Gammaproteobacteria bacterium]|nr:recombination protein O N-terminal domain-containing protein [Gammaproteobacteria bacterium]
MEIRVSDQAAFILRRRDWQNTSLLLDVFSRDYGCLRVLARGARRNPAKTPFQPFALLTLGWSGKQELKTLIAIDGVPLPVDERNYLSLMYVNELIGAMLPAYEPSVEIFDAYLALLKSARMVLGEAGLRRFEHELMRRQGYFPDIGEDAESGEPIRADRHYQFVLDRGFVACPEAARDSVSGQTVLDWNAGSYQLDSVLRLAKSVLRSTIDFNLHGKALKSRGVLQEIMGKR